MIAERALQKDQQDEEGAPSGATAAGKSTSATDSVERMMREMNVSRGEAGGRVQLDDDNDEQESSDDDGEVIDKSES